MTREQFFKESAGGAFFDDPKAIADYCCKFCKEETKHILRVADEVLNQYFLFDLKWDMERTYEPVTFEEEIDWGYQPADDPEFVWQFNRHRFFICLGQAYQLTGDEKYANCFAKQLTDWIKRVKLTEETKNHMWRSLEAGLRGEYWTKAFRYFRDSPAITEKVVDLYVKSLIEHAEYLMSVHSPYKLMSNWGVLENHGLFEIVIAIPFWKGARAAREMAIQHLETEARMQIMKDGVQWEQSPMYHNEVLHCYLDVILLAQRNGIKLPESILSQTKKMAFANLAWKKPDHHQFLMGDSDDTDIRDTISVAAYIFKDSVLRFGGYEKLDFDGIWDLGYQAAAEYEAMEKKHPDFTSIALSDSGNYYLRSDWSKAANLLHFHCGTLGAGHGHSDKLHVDLTIYGEDILMDAGRFHYVAGANRYAFKDPMAHNTITVDNELFTVCKDSWECSKLSQPVKQQFVDNDAYSFIQGGHLGYMDLPNGVFVNRKIVHIKPDIYLLFDEMYTGGQHSYQQYFHFNEMGSVFLNGQKAEYRGKQAAAEFYFLRKDAVITKEDSRLSRHYNQAAKNTRIKVDFSGSGFQSTITAVCGRKAEQTVNFKVKKIPVCSKLKGITYADSMAEAVLIETKGNSYVVIVCHQEVNSPTDLVEAGGCIGFGNVLVFLREKEVGCALNW